MHQQLLGAAVFFQARGGGPCGRRERGENPAKNHGDELFHGADDRRVQGLRENSSAAQSMNTRTLVDRCRFAGYSA